MRTCAAGSGHRRIHGGLTVLMVVLGLLAGCQAPQESADDGPPTEEESPEERDLAAKPDMSTVLTDDRGDPPENLEVTDLVEGDGERASAGDVLTVHYVGAAWSSGSQFDATWDRSQPYTFTLGSGSVIEGWEVGVEGMRVGGRRVLTIPPELAYGDRGSGRDIAPGETIVFIIDLLSVEE